MGLNLSQWLAKFESAVALNAGQAIDTMQLDTVVSMLVQVSDATVGAYLSGLTVASWAELVKALGDKFGAHRWQVMIELSRFA